MTRSSRRSGAARDAAPARVAGAAYAWAAANLSWARTMAAYDALYDQLLDARPHADAAALRAP
jgi:hypothetical protein